MVWQILLHCDLQEWKEWTKCRTFLGRCTDSGSPLGSMYSVHTLTHLEHSEIGCIYEWISTQQIPLMYLEYSLEMSPSISITAPWLISLMCVNCSDIIKSKSKLDSITTYYGSPKRKWFDLLFYPVFLSSGVEYLVITRKQSPFSWDHRLIL